MNHWVIQATIHGGLGLAISSSIQVRIKLLLLEEVSQKNDLQHGRYSLIITSPQNPASEDVNCPFNHFTAVEYV